MPELAVIIPYFNNEKTLPMVLDGLACSTTKPDVFIADDASHLPPTDIIKNYAHKLDIKLITRTKNGGQAAAINSCLREILQQDYRFIALNDADDVSHPERFSRQMDYLEIHALDLCGTAANVIHPETQRLRFIISHPQTHNAIATAIYYNSSFVHPSIMFRRTLIDKVGLYNETYKTAADFEFFYRVQQDNHLKMGNMPDILMDYYLGTHNISVQKRRTQTLNRLCTQLHFFTPTNIHSYLGVVRTLLALLLPFSLLNKLKELKHYHSTL